MNFIKVTAEDGYILAINADQIEHVRYYPATHEESAPRIEIMFVGNPERTFFDGQIAEQLWEILFEHKAGQ